MSLNKMFSNKGKGRIAKSNNSIPDISNQDVSNQKVYNISQASGGNRIASTLVPDQETANLISWLAQEQGISPEHALKRAVATAAYIHDLTENEKGTLLVLLKDGSSIRKILLK